MNPRWKVTYHPSMIRNKNPGTQLWHLNADDLSRVQRKGIISDFRIFR